MNDCKHPEYDFYHNDNIDAPSKKCKQCKKIYNQHPEGHWVDVFTLEHLKWKENNANQKSNR